MPTALRTIMRCDALWDVPLARSSLTNCLTKKEKMMEKKDYFDLNELYSIVKNHESLLRTTLIKFVHDAFDKHGNVFEYKCDTHNSWDDKIAEGAFDAMNDLPTSLTIWVDDDGGHEVYPVCIRQKETSFGYKYMEVSGWDWYENCWIDNVEVHSPELEAIADFVNAVLEQEQEKNELIS